jgi:hypothetical protein
VHRRLCEADWEKLPNELTGLRGLTDEKLNQHSYNPSPVGINSRFGSGRRCDCDPSTSFRPASQSSSGAYSSCAFAIPRSA